MYVGVMKNNYALISIGMFGLVVSIANAQSPNNDCNFPQAISGYVVTAYSTVGATTDGIAAPSCLFFSTSQIYNDIWYCWTAPSNDFVKIDLCGSTFDNKLAVYSDCSHCPDPALVIACNDDTCGTSATVTFNSQAGHSYGIRVGAYAATGTGTGNLTIGSGWLLDATNPANNHRYVAYATTTWAAAEATAISAGGHLVTINDLAESDWVHLNFGNISGTDRRSWIGFNDEASEGTFVWSSGEPVAFTNWNAGEPNNSGGVEDYAEMLGSNSKWNDLNLAGASYAHIGIAELGPTAPLCIADLDGDRVVGGSDLSVILSNWGGGGAGDLNGDGLVSGPDLTTMLSAWGVCP